MDREQYIAFMCNKENIHNCEECPENREFGNQNDQLPCGQYNCWVTCHCYPEKFRA